MKKPIVAAQLYTLRDFLKETAELPKTFAKVKKIGYDYAQISGLTAEVAPADLRKIMLDQGVEPIGAHVSLEAWRNNFKESIETIHGYGVKYAAIPWLSWAKYKEFSPAEWKKLFREFDTIAKKAAKEGIIVQYHNHDFEFNQFGIKNGKGGMDPVLWAQRMKGRMDQVHLKDWGLINGEFTFRAIGQGRINWPAVIKECKKGGTHTFIIEQDSCKATNDPFKSLAISREYLKPLLG